MVGCFFSALNFKAFGELANVSVTLFPDCICNSAALSTALTVGLPLLACPQHLSLGKVSPQPLQNRIVEIQLDQHMRYTATNSRMCRTGPTIAISQVLILSTNSNGHKPGRRHLIKRFSIQSKFLTLLIQSSTGRKLRLLMDFI
jgi:hypothetical protein